MKLNLARITTLQAALLSAIAVLIAGGKGLAADTSTKSIAELQRERIEVLGKLVKWEREKYESGSSDISSVIRAIGQLAEARLQAARSPEAAIAIRREIAENSRVLEALAERRVADGIAGRNEVLEARANRLKAELELLQAAKGRE